jgi:hypothetical protein
MPISHEHLSLPTVVSISIVLLGNKVDDEGVAGSEETTEF